MTEPFENSRDDAAEDSLKATQSLLMQWQWPIAFGPFLLLVVVAQTHVASAIPHWMILPLIFATTFWAVAFKGYLLYLNYQK